MKPMVKYEKKKKVVPLEDRSFYQVSVILGVHCRPYHAYVVVVGSVKV